MKRFAITALGLASAGSLCAQSLFDLAPGDETNESIPLTWTLSAGLGYDDNPTPTLAGTSSSTYATGQIGASFLSQTPQSTLEFFARVGVIHYLDTLPPGVDETTYTAGLGVNWTHRVSERVRLSSRNYITHELEPDFASGISGARQLGSYTRYASDNAIGYRWSERLGTYTGVTFDGTTYDDAPAADVESVTFYNDFRYQLSPQTVATLTYRYSERDVVGTADSTNHFILAGLEHRFSPNTIGILRAGVQKREVDGVPFADGTSPSLEAALRSQINEQFSVRAYARYGVEDYGRFIGGLQYADTETLRLGITGNYRVSEALSLRAGVNYQDIGYENLIAGPVGTPLSAEEDLINVFLGFDLKVADNMWVTGTYNFEDLGSDVAAARNYDRNKINLGVRAEF
ncbi:MAG: outer membrane beta-barrel protein [Verrucomicrobiaceae bacterium]